jgi:hypothetical protein
MGSSPERLKCPDTCFVALTVHLQGGNKTMFNRKLSTLAAVVFLSALPVVASASTARLEGMTLPGDYTSDYTSIYSWPATITGLGNLVYGELGSTTASTSDKAMGAVLPNMWDGKYGVWAIHLRQMTPSLGQGDTQTNPAPGSAGFDPNSNGNQSFDLGWGKKSGKSAFGVTLTRSFNSFKDEIPGTTTLFERDGAVGMNLNGTLARNIFGIGVGASTEWNENTTVEGSILWQTRSFEGSRTGAVPFKYEDNGGANYMLAVRAMHKCTPTMTVVPVFKYYAYDLSNKGTGAVGAANLGTFDNTAKGWQAGVAGNWAIGSNDLFVLGGTFAQNKLDQQQDLFGVATATGLNDTLTATETLTPQVFMALETQVNSWLTLRFGANKAAWRNAKVEGYTGAGTTHTAQTLTLKDSPFAMATGAGVKLGSLKFDAVLASSFFNDPFSDLINGRNNGSTTPFTKVTATYNW